jgi:hypothetical protein
MATHYIVALLVAERDKLNRAIAELGGSAKKRRGRPPKNPYALPSLAASPRKPAKKRGGGRSAAARKAQSLRMKAYWAKRRKQATA